MTFNELVEKAQRDAEVADALLTPLQRKFGDSSAYKPVGDAKWLEGYFMALCDLKRAKDKRDAGDGSPDLTPGVPVDTVPSN